MGSRTDALDGRDVSPRYGASFSAAGAYLAWLLALLVAVFVAVSIGRVVVDAASAAQRVAQMREANAELKAQVDALSAEKQVVTSGVFVQVAGRGQGYGAANERAFGLLPGAARPTSLDPATSEDQGRGSPLDAWLTALFGE
jgi:hypothetical protein